MSESILVNGQWQTTLAATDRGLHYGDGVFRTLRVEAGEPRVWTQQYRHLAADCVRLDLPAPDPEMLYLEARQLFADGDDGVLKIIVTRGSGGRGYAPPQPATPSRLLLRYPVPRGWHQRGQDGVRIIACQTQLGCNPVLAGVKHLNRLEQVWARRECEAAGAAEGLVCDATGQLVSGVMSNLFAVQDGVLVTPLLNTAGVAGLTRQRILSAAQQQGRESAERPLRPVDLAGVSELFLCNSVFGVWPVTHWDGREFKIGPMARWAQALVALE